MDKKLELHKALSEAVVECQRKFDAQKEFLQRILENGITNPEEQIKEKDRLDEELRIAEEKKRIAYKDYWDYTKGIQNPHD